MLAQSPTNPKYSEEDFLESYKKTYVEEIVKGLTQYDVEIKKHLKEENDMDALETLKEDQEYALEKLKIFDNFLFTDWKEPDTSRGIVGPEEVKKQIEEYLEQFFHPRQL